MSWNQVLPQWTGLIQAIQPSVTAVPRDAIVNTWVVRRETNGTFGINWPAVVDWLHDNFYNATEVRIRTPNQLVTPTMLYKCYRMDAAPPRFPEEELSRVRTTMGAGLPHPEEVAMVCSFRGEPNVARRRGRIFYGPLIAGTLAVDDGRTHMTSTIRNHFRDALQALLDNQPTGHQWSIWSRVEADVFPVVAAWVDDAFDTQRRRGPRAVMRSVTT